MSSLYSTLLWATEFLTPASTTSFSNGYQHSSKYLNLSERVLTQIYQDSNGNVKYQLKAPYRNGTTHVIFEPLDFMAKLAALIPKPKVNLTRFHGVFAPNSQYRQIITAEGKAYFQYRH